MLGRAESDTVLMGVRGAMPGKPRSSRGLPYKLTPVARDAVGDSVMG